MKLSGKNITVPLARKMLGLPGREPSAFNRCVGGQLRGVHASYAEMQELLARAAHGHCARSGHDCHYRRSGPVSREQSLMVR